MWLPIRLGDAGILGKLGGKCTNACPIFPGKMTTFRKKPGKWMPTIPSLVG
jgi:hypothetical protein